MADNMAGVIWNLDARTLSPVDAVEVKVLAQVQKGIRIRPETPVGLAIATLSLYLGDRAEDPESWPSREGIVSFRLEGGYQGIHIRETVDNYLIRTTGPIIPYPGDWEGLQTEGREEGL